MSNKYSSLTTLKVIGQVVDVTYRGPQARNSQGTLARFLNEKSINTSRDESIPTTSSQDILPELGSNVEEINSGKLDAAFISINAVADLVPSKVQLFHHKLKNLKAEYLNGKTRVELTQSDLDDIKNRMSVFNVGKVIKLTLQIRLVSDQEFPGSRACKDGFSQTRVLRKTYVPYDEKRDIKDQVQEWAQHVIEIYNADTVTKAKLNSALVLNEDMRDARFDTQVSTSVDITLDSGEVVTAETPKRIFSNAFGSYKK